MTKSKSAAFDWHSAPLSIKTKITDDYKNTQNVRRFFRAQLGADFRIDRDFMAWLKASTGKTLGSAVLEWKRRQLRGR